MHGAHRGGVVQDRRVQGLGARQGVRHHLQEARLQPPHQYERRALQAAHGPHAPDQGAPAVPRVPGRQRPAVQPRGVRPQQGQGRADRQGGRRADPGPGQHPQRRELARHGRRLGPVHVQAAGPRTGRGQG